MTLALIPSRPFPCQIISGTILSSTNYFTVPLVLCICSASITAVPSLCSTVIILLTLPVSTSKGFCKESYSCAPSPSVPDPAFSSLQSCGFSALTVQSALLSGHTVHYLRIGMLLYVCMYLSAYLVFLLPCTVPSAQ